MPHVRPEGDQGGIESFEMTTLQHSAALRGGGDSFDRLPPASARFGFSTST
jgi:hypothetical protein